MFPILGRFSFGFLYSYTVSLCLGVLVSLALTAWQARDGDYPGWFDAFLFVLGGGLIGGRVGFVWGHWDYFQDQPLALIRLWQGGLSYHGALLGTLVCLWLWCRWQNRQFGEYAGLLAQGLALIVVFGWSACWLEGCAYGRETIVHATGLINLLTGDLPDDLGVFARRYQTQLLGALLSLAAFGLIWRHRRRYHGARRFWLTLLLLTGIHLSVGFLRGDLILRAGPFRLGTLLDLGMVLIAAVLLKYAGAGSRQPIEGASGLPEQPTCSS